MPLPIICAYNCLQQYLMSSRDLFTKPQYTSFVIVLLGFIQCQQARTLSGLQCGVAEGVSLSGLSRFFARSPWDTEALAAQKEYGLACSSNGNVLSLLVRHVAKSNVFIDASSRFGCDSSSSRAPLTSLCLNSSLLKTRSFRKVQS